MQRIDDKALAEIEARLRALLLEGMAGDARAYHDFLQALSAHLRAFLRRRLGGQPEDAEDLVQECLLAVHNQRHTYDSSMPLTAWVHAIAKYKLIDRLRRRARRESRHDTLDDASELLAASDIEATDARHDVGVYLAQLPPQQRLPLIHMKLHGLSVADAARATGMSESAIKVGVHRGLKALAALIGRST